MALGAGVWSTGISPGGNLEAESGKRVGIIGLDTGHSEAFTKRINGGAPDMLGYKVVAAYPEGSPDIASALKMKPGIIKAVAEMGVELVNSIDQLLQKVDVVLLESNDGRVHPGQALPVFRSGKKVFIDKPLAASAADARAIFEMAEKYRTPLFSSSSLRFDPNVVKVVNGGIGQVRGADVYVPFYTDPTHPDMAWYGIHGIEMLYAVFGTGCRRLSLTHTGSADMVVAEWKDGRIGTLRAISQGASDIAGTAFGDKGIAPLGPFTSYEPLVKEIVRFFESGKPPVSAAETLEIFEFIDAAQISKSKGGSWVDLKGS